MRQEVRHRLNGENFASRSNYAVSRSRTPPPPWKETVKKRAENGG